MKSFDKISQDFPLEDHNVYWKYSDKLRQVQDPTFKNEYETLLRGRTAIVNIGSIRFSIQTQNFTPYLVFKEEHAEHPSYADNVYELWSKIKYQMTMPMEKVA